MCTFKNNTNCKLWGMNSMLITLERKGVVENACDIHLIKALCRRELQKLFYTKDTHIVLE